MHSAEQILRAELAEKRQLLKNIRKELEETRASWNIVKQKNAESEIQWLKLKADCEERRRILMSSSESGFSELGTPDNDKAEEDTDSDEVEKQSSEKREQTPEIIEEFDEEEDSESEEIPDPFSDDEDDIIEEIPQHFTLPVPVTTTVNEELEEEDDDEEDILEPEQEKGQTNSTTFTPIFVPSMSYLAQVPSEMQPELISPNEKEIRALEHLRPSRDRLDENVFENENEVDDNVRDLIIRLSSSTARGAFLANRLADIHRRIATGTSLTDHNDWFDNEEVATETDETETDLFPREEEEEELTVPSPEIASDFDEVPPISEEDNSSHQVEEEESRPASVDSLVLAIDEAINILDPVNSHPQLNSFLSVSSTNSPPMTDVSFPIANTEDDTESNDEDDVLQQVVADIPSDIVEHQSQEQPATASVVSDSSTAVTRYLIKHLPKQLTQLRNQKHELEDKIHDLEQVTMNMEDVIVQLILNTLGCF